MVLFQVDSKAALIKQWMPEHARLAVWMIEEQNWQAIQSLNQASNCQSRRKLERAGLRM